MTTLHDEFGPDFESPADPAHASAFGKTGASNAGIGRKADSPRDRDAGARSHEADASDATNAPCAEEKGGEEEIEVTEEMIEAGLMHLFCYVPGSGDSVGYLEDIYRAMVRAKTQVGRNKSFVAPNPKVST